MYHSKSLLTLSLIAILSFFCFSCQKTTKQEAIGSNDQGSTDQITVPIHTVRHSTQPILMYGIDVSNSIVDEAEVVNNEKLDAILTRYNVAPAQLDSLFGQKHKSFNPKKIKPGYKYVTINDIASNRLQYFIYEHGLDKYVVLDFTGSGVRLEAKAHPIDYRVRQVGGNMSESLYETMNALDMSPAVAQKMIQVFEHSVDFFKMKKDDNFRVIFEEKYIDGKKAGTGKIYAFAVTYQDSTYYAFLQDDGQGKYYNEKGESMKKGYLKAPLDFTRISSKYSLNRFHPVQQRWKAHLGVDYAAPEGTPIRAIGQGVVLEAQYGSMNGNYVKLQHTKNHSSQYLHMCRIEKGLKPGMKVKQGQVIGYVGSTGLATGPHLCFRFWDRGTQIDPLSVRDRQGDPLVGVNWEHFMRVRDAFYPMLENVPLTDPQEVPAALAMKKNEVKNTKIQQVGS